MSHRHEDLKKRKALETLFVPQKPTFDNVLLDFAHKQTYSVRGVDLEGKFRVQSQFFSFSNVLCYEVHDLQARACFLHLGNFKCARRPDRDATRKVGSHESLSSH